MLMQRSFKLYNWFFVKNNLVYLIHGNTGMLKTKLNGAVRKRVIMFFSGKALFRGGSNHFAVFQQARGRIMVVTREA
jgi:hypothetical protein